MAMTPEEERLRDRLDAAVLHGLRTAGIVRGSTYTQQDLEWALRGWSERDRRAVNEAVVRGGRVRRAIAERIGPDADMARFTHRVLELSGPRSAARTDPQGPSPTS